LRALCARFARTYADTPSRTTRADLCIAIRRSPRAQGAVRGLVMHKTFARVLQWSLMP
jgi:hypothetical protein